MTENDFDFSVNGMNDLLFRSTIQKNNVHIRIQQRNGRKRITVIEGLPREGDIKDTFRSMQKTFNCGGQLLVNEHIIILTGDQRQKVHDYLINHQIAPKDCIKVHGY